MNERYIKNQIHFALNRFRCSKCKKAYTISSSNVYLMSNYSNSKYTDYRKKLVESPSTGGLILFMAKNREKTFIPRHRAKVEKSNLSSYDSFISDFIYLKCKCKSYKYIRTKNGYHEVMSYNSKHYVMLTTTAYGSRQRLYWW